MISLPTALVVFCVVVGIFFLVLWSYYDRRDHHLFEGERRKASFHCIRCDRLYAAKGGSEQAKCPHCAHENTRLRY